MSRPMPYAALAARMDDLTEENTCLYWAHELRTVMRTRIDLSVPRQVAAERHLLDAMRHVDRAFHARLPGGTERDAVLLRLCWLVCRFNFHDARDLTLLVAPCTWNGDAKTYYWEHVARMSDTPFPRVDGAGNTFFACGV